MNHGSVSGAAGPISASLSELNRGEAPAILGLDQLNSTWDEHTETIPAAF